MPALPPKLLTTAAAGAELVPLEPVWMDVTEAQLSGGTTRAADSKAAAAEAVGARATPAS